MTPIINPLVFYFMDIADGLDLFCGIFGIIAFICAVVTTVIYFSECSDWGADSDEAKSTNAIRKLLSWTAAILLLVVILIPSQNTITKMLIAQNVTYERVETVTDTVETVYNDIMELFESNE